MISIPAKPPAKVGTSRESSADADCKTYSAADERRQTRIRQKVLIRAHPCSSAANQGAECKFCREAEFSASARRLRRSRSVGEPSGARPSAGAAVEALPTFPRSKRKRCHPNDGTRKSTHGYGW